MVFVDRTERSDSARRVFHARIDAAFVLAPVVISAVAVSVTFRYRKRPRYLRLVGALDVRVADVARSARADSLVVDRVALRVDPATVNPARFGAAASDALVGIVAVRVDVALGLFVYRSAATCCVGDRIRRTLAQDGSQWRCVQDPAFLVWVAHRGFSARVAAHQVDTTQLSRAVGIHAALRLFRLFST